MKQFLAAVLVAVLVLPSPVLAHGGRTDASGGHYNHSTGEYHYHHGYSAHQHPNGVCPYNFDDQTDHGSGTTSSNPSNSGSSSWVYVDSHFFEGFRYNESTDEWLRDDGEYYESSGELFDCYGFYYDYGCDVWYNEDGFIDEDFCVRDHSDGGFFYCDSCQTLMYSFDNEDPDAHDDYCSYIEELEESREEAMAFMADNNDSYYDDYEDPVSDSSETKLSLLEMLFIGFGIVVLGFLLVLAVAQTIGFFYCAHTIIQDIIDYFGRSRKNK